jgi:hypothetical protein
MKDDNITNEIIEQAKKIYIKEKFPFALLWVIKEDQLLHNIVINIENSPEKIKAFILIKKYLKENNIKDYIISSNEGVKIPKDNPLTNRKNSKLNSSKDIKEQTFFNNGIEKGFRNSKALIFYYAAQEEKKMIIIPYEITDPYYNTVEFEAPIEKSLMQEKGGLIFNLI